jgi:SpoVK/Ycf46/Vps4 family AAA+-type ATPase
MFSSSDGAVFSTIPASRLASIEVWKGNRTLDKTHVERITHDLKQVQDLNADVFKILCVIEDEQPKKENQLTQADNPEKLNLSFLLNLLDGVLETPGRIIIMTSNHPEKLDKALIRPGRIDIEIEFKKLRYPHIAQIYKKWYGKKLEDIYTEEIPDYKYSQAEISQLLFKYENDSKGFIQEIKNNY